MGTILDGYGDDTYDHEGYAAQVLADGSITGTYSAETKPRMIGAVVAACSCGWAGATRYPCPTIFDETAETLALTEWEHSHARPELDQGQARRWDQLWRLVQDALSHLSRGPGDAQRLARTLRDLTAATELARRLSETDEQAGQ